MCRNFLSTFADLQRGQSSSALMRKMLTDIIAPRYSSAIIIACGVAISKMNSFQTVLMEPSQTSRNMNWAPMFFPKRGTKAIAEITKIQKYPASLPDIRARLKQPGGRPENRERGWMRSHQLLPGGKLGGHFQRRDLPPVRQAHDDKDARCL